VPFGQDLALIDGTDITLELTLEADGWRGLADATFHIEDAEDCYEDPSGGLICE